MAMQLLTIGRTGPIFFLLGIYSTQNGISSRRVPIEVAKSILPAITLGFLIPSALMLLPLGDSFLRQNAIAYWQFVPAYCAALTTFLSRFGFQKVHYASTVKPEKKGKERKLSAFEHTMPKRNQDYEDSFSEYAKDDVPHLKSAYAVAFVVCTLMHVGILAYLALGLNPALTLSSVFLNLPSIFSDWDLLDPLLSWSILFKYDMWFYFASLFVYLMYTVWDLRRLGYVTNVQAAKALLAIVVGQVLVGPGAVYAGVWWWKEDVVASFGH
jgi:hypothetical protein